MRLRPYQEKIIQDVKRKFANGKKRVIMCAPTGAGKTVMFTSIILQTLQKNMFNRILVVTDRIELFKQTWKQLKAVDVDPVIYNANIKPHVKVTGRCIVGMIETLKRRAKAGKLNIGEFDLIIIDEAHKGNFKAIFKIFPDAYYIGATATPFATSKKDPLKNYYDDISEVVGIPELIDAGYLAPEHSYKMDLIDESKLKRGANGDFTEASQYDAFNDIVLFDGLMKAYKKHCIGKKTIIFCPNIKMTLEVRSMLIGSGFEAYSITSEDKKAERELSLKEFHNSKSGVMVNCGILTTGYDHPPIEAGIIYRATTSLPLWLQMCGRVGRTHDGKKEALLIDLGGNINRHSEWSYNHNWTNWFWNPPKRGTPKPPPVKECPSCESIIPARIMLCKFCGHKFESKERELAKGELVEHLKMQFSGKHVDQIDINGLIQLEKNGIYKSSYVWRIVRTRGDIALSEYARLTGKKDGWIYYQKQQGTGYNNYRIKI